jgi:hypothetical protein
MTDSRPPGSPRCRLRQSKGPRVNPEVPAKDELLSELARTEKLASTRRKASWTADSGRRESYLDINAECY